MSILLLLFSLFTALKEVIIFSVPRVIYIVFDLFFAGLIFNVGHSCHLSLCIKEHLIYIIGEMLLSCEGSTLEMVFYAGKRGCHRRVFWLMGQIYPKAHVANPTRA